MAFLNLGTPILRACQACLLTFSAAAGPAAKYLCRDSCSMPGQCSSVVEMKILGEMMMETMWLRLPRQPSARRRKPQRARLPPKERKPPCAYTLNAYSALQVGVHASLLLRLAVLTL